jgi:transposase
LEPEAEPLGRRTADDKLDTLKAGQTLIADAGYDSDRLRTALKKRRAKACINPMPNQKKRYSPRRKACAKHNLVERFFNTLKHFRAIANRFEKHAANFLARVKLASARL